MCIKRTLIKWNESFKNDMKAGVQGEKKEMGYQDWREEMEG